MTIIKTSDLIGPALDWAVAKCEELDIVVLPERQSSYAHVEFRSEKTGWDFRNYSPSTDWSKGEPIIEREKIDPSAMDESSLYMAEPAFAPTSVQDRVRQTGQSILIAAMRCYVASKLGDTVDVPDELV